MKLAIQRNICVELFSKESESMVSGQVKVFCSYPTTTPTMATSSKASVTALASTSLSMKTPLMKVTGSRTKSTATGSTDSLMAHFTKAHGRKAG